MALRPRHALQTAAVFLFTLALAEHAGAQAMTVFGSNKDARDCFEQAQLAAATGVRSAGPVDACDRALGEIRLRHSDRAATFVNRGILHASAGHGDAARADYNEALRLRPDLAAVHLNRGNLEFVDGAFESAIALYGEAISGGLTQAHVAHLNRGMAYEQMGRLDDAERDYRRALALVPEWTAGQDKLDRVLRKRSDSSRLRPGSRPGGSPPPQ